MLQNNMNQQDMKDPSLPCDSEVSVDYYVTTVNNCSPQNVTDHGFENSSVNPEITVVVSIDQDSGVIKLRKRKKSKRRKKKSRSAIQESEFHASDDGILFPDFGGGRMHYDGWRIVQSNVVLQPRALATPTTVIRRGTNTCVLSSTLMRGTCLGISVKCLSQDTATQPSMVIEPRVSNLSITNPTLQLTELPMNIIAYRSSSSDSSERKVPRRSVSLCDRYVRKTSTSESFNKMLSDYRRGDKKRNFSKLSKTVTEHNGEVENSVLTPKSEKVSLTTNEQQKPVNQHDSSAVNEKEKLQVSKDDNQVLHSSTEHLPGVITKKINRNDAIATLNAFMLEVQQATSVAKQREDKKKKESHSLESQSSSDFNSESAQEIFSDPVSLSPVPESVSSTSPDAASRNPEFQKSESVLSGGSVFFSENDLSTTRFLLSSEEPHNSPLQNCKEKAKSTLEMRLMEKTDDASENDGSANHASLQLDTPRTRNIDYGLAHLEQVCKLIEQIGDLRKQNQALVKQVHLLESEVKLLRKEKVTSLSDYSLPETYQTLNIPKRTHAVGRLKEAIAKSSRKISSDKSESKKNQLFNSLNDSSDRISLSASTPVSSFMPMSKEKQFSRSHMDLNLANRQRRYSHDDIEVDIKGNKWRFWKAPSRSVDRQHSNRQTDANKCDVNDKSSNAIRRAFLTVDSLDSDSVSQTQSRMKPLRTSSRVSDISGENFGCSTQSHTSAKPPKYDENLRQKNQRLSSETAVHKPSFRKKLTKWEKNAARKFHRRSNSVDRTASNGNGIDYPKQKNLSSNDIYKSMPCVVPGLDEEVYRKKNSIISMSSNEWKSLQEAFPTKPPNGKPTNGFRLPSAIRSRLTSPLGRKSSNKRKTWSFAKRKSGYYLPNADFSFGPSYELTESIGEQLTLNLDHDDVKDAIKTEPEEGNLIYTSKQADPTREKLDDTNNQNWKGTTQHSQDRQRPGSALARHRAESNRSDENDSTRTRCPFFPSIKSRKNATPIFV